MGTTQSVKEVLVTEGDQQEHFDTQEIDEGDFESVVSQESIVPSSHGKKEIHKAYQFLRAQNVPIDEKQAKLD